MADFSNAWRSMKFRLAMIFAGILVTFALVDTPTLRADIKLPAVLNSHMVLQRDMPIPVW